MYAKGEQQELIETFEGHSDVVKEFVWREGAQGPFFCLPLLVVETECHFGRRLPINNLVEGSYTEVLAY